MKLDKFENEINLLWSTKDIKKLKKNKSAVKLIKNIINFLDSGRVRVSEKVNGKWIVNEWVKKAVLLFFTVTDQTKIAGGPDNTNWWDKVPSKFKKWDRKDFVKSGFRVVPNAVVRKGTYLGEGAVIMPSFINIGAYVGKSTMIDTWCTVGSCAQIGNNCHISGGVGIGGVLEPLQASPVIIEDNCFIGARSEIAEGVIVKEGSVISMGVYLGASTKIVDRSNGKIYYGTVPKYSVVVPGTLNNNSSVNLYCAVIVKTVDEKTRSKTSINELLRS